MDQAAQLQIEDLQKRLEEAEETLRALRNGEVDAIVAAGPEGDRVYTLKGADEPYRAMVQGMAEGACTLAANGLILFSNEQFASILQSPLERVIGARIQDFVAPDDLGLAHRLVAGCGRRRAELRLQSQGGALVTVYLSFEDLIVDGTRCLSAIVTDLTAQKRNEAIVAEGEFARSVLEHAGEAILVVDPDGTIIRGGQAADLLAGVSVLGLRFDEVFEIRVPGGIEYRFRDLAAAANCGEGIRGIEGSALTRTGHTIDVRVRAAKLSLSNGHAGFVFTITDFTELRQAEKALRRSEERRKIAEAVQTERQRLNEVLENLPVMVSLLTPDYQVRFANSRFREFFGESNGRRCYEYIAGLSEPCPQCQTFLPLKTQSPNQWEYRGSDGACLAVYNLPFKDADGSPLIVEVDVDITERKRAEAALRESEERFRNLADTAPVMIWVSGTDKACTFFDKAWLNFTGKTMPEESRGGWADGIHPEDLERSRATYCKAFEARSPYRMEYRRRSADGSYRWVRSDGVPRFGPDGLFAGYIGSCIDVTDTKRTHEELLARQKLETVGVLAGGVAHDFNNLLGSILANLELASAELPDDSPAQDELVQINTTAQRAAEIVRQLMAYAGKENAVFQPIDLSEVAREMLTLLKVSISKRAVVKADLPNGLPAVWANAGQIRQIIMNLVTNASEALGEDGGVITVATSKVTLPRHLTERATTLPDGDYVRVDVCDTGCGMTSEVLGKIFDPFFSTKFAGRGLGLAAVHGIIRTHGGSIDVVSAPGQGTRFEILLPCMGGPVREISGPKHADSSTVESSLSGTVLVVEDEEALRSSVAKMLRRSGFTVIEAGDGLAGVEAFKVKASQIDVVLLDMTLPGKSGAAVLSDLRHLRPDVKVILTTAYSQETVLDTVGKDEFARFLRKPYRLGDLVDCIQSICDERMHGSPKSGISRFSVASRI